MTCNRGQEARCTAEIRDVLNHVRPCLHRRDFTKNGHAYVEVPATKIWVLSTRRTFAKLLRLLTSSRRMLMTLPREISRQISGTRWKIYVGRLKNHSSSSSRPTSLVVRPRNKLGSRQCNHVSKYCSSRSGHRLSRLRWSTKSALMRGRIPSRDGVGMCKG